MHLTKSFFHAYIFKDLILESMADTFKLLFGRDFWDGFYITWFFYNSCHAVQAK